MGGDRGGRTHVCLRRVEPAAIFAAIAEHHVTHLCGAPIVLNMLVHAPEADKRRFDHVVEAATGGAAPPSAVIEAMERMGFRVTHLYGLTGAWPVDGMRLADEWDALPAPSAPAGWRGKGWRSDPRRPARGRSGDDGRPAGRRRRSRRTGIAQQHPDEGLSQKPGDHDAAFARGWFHTGDLAVMHPDGYVEIKDRTKDIIISGGENISSLEIEEVLYRHPAVIEAAVVARPDPVWGESPCAFVDAEARCRRRGGGHHRLVPRASRPLQGAALGRVRAAAEDLDRQDPEIRIARAGQGIARDPDLVMAEPVPAIYATFRGAVRRVVDAPSPLALPPSFHNFMPFPLPPCGTSPGRRILGTADE